MRTNLKLVCLKLKLVGLVGKDGEDAAAGPLDKRKYQQILPDSSLINHGTLLKTIEKSKEMKENGFDKVARLWLHRPFKLYCLRTKTGILQIFHLFHKTYKNKRELKSK